MYCNHHLAPASHINVKGSSKDKVKPAVVCRIRTGMLGDAAASYINFDNALCVASAHSAALQPAEVMLFIDMRPNVSTSTHKVVLLLAFLTTAIS